ncbi:peroxidase-like [Amyelois transitella]|uniref:peroxidase-like n=1 Tax=Amyelois transitella TaxID=680683 RepID=UPI00298F4C44|nr:peroxidase-like [Amyelois transitella]
MMLKYAISVLLIQTALAQVLYDVYYGKPITQERNNTLTLLNATSPCMISVQPCKKHEGRRVDGTCVNPKYPSRNGSPTPLLRMLPAKFGLGNTLRPAMNGSELPSARLIRTKILSEGYHADHHFTTLAANLFLLAVGDYLDVLYLLRYVMASECCLGNTPNRASPDCIAIPVPEDDPFLRRSGVRCMNLTRFQTYQDFRCIPNTLPAERITLSTPLLDLSIIYGNTEQQAARTRTYRNGLLRSELRDGIERPPANAATCVNNVRPRENSCFEFGDSFGGNTLQGSTIVALVIYREHNRLARELAGINPCWGDQELYETAREINIAQYQHLMYYELMALLLGRENALQVGIIYNTDGYVDDFDARYKPGVFHEFVLGTRYFHTFQEGRSYLYSNKGKYLGTRTVVDDSFRSGIYELNNTEADLTQGTFRQPAAKFDHNMDPDIAERVFGSRQRASDLPAIDIKRGRDHGVPPYNAYRKLCGLPVARKWEDFKEIHPDKLEQFKRLYEDVDDLELMPAIYSEKWVKGAVVGPTLFCIMTQNLVQWRKSDRHFFEHGDLPTSLTLPQLHEIRKTSVARLMCDSGVGVTHIQPEALLVESEFNKMVPCKAIPSLDLSAWEDPKCHKKNDDKKQDVKDNRRDPVEDLSWQSYIDIK